RLAPFSSEPSPSSTTSASFPRRSTPSRENSWAISRRPSAISGSSTPPGTFPRPSAGRPLPPKVTPRRPLRRSGLLPDEVALHESGQRGFELRRERQRKGEAGTGGI